MRSRATAALLLAAALACTNALPRAEGRAAFPGERFELHPGESATITGTPATVRFERIVSDNRCAIDVVCIVAGEARASFRLEAEPGRSETFTLDTARNAAAVAGGYRISLVSVSPAPRSTVSIDPRNYIVELVVTRE